MLSLRSNVRHCSSTSRGAPICAPNSIIRTVPRCRGRRCGASVRCQVPGQFGDAVGGEGKNAVGCRIAAADMDDTPHRAEKIDEHQIAGETTDLEPEGEGAFRVKRKGHRRLADTAALQAPLENQSVGSSWRMMTVMVCAESPVWRAISARGSLPGGGGSATGPGLVVKAHAVLVGAAGEIRRARTRSFCRGTVAARRCIPAERGCPSPSPATRWSVPCAARRPFSSPHAGRASATMRTIARLSITKSSGLILTSHALIVSWLGQVRCRAGECRWERPPDGKANEDGR